MSTSTFEFKDCASIPIATGVKAQALTELRDRLADIPSESLYHHFWGRFFDPEFKNQEYHNDFALWSHFSLNDEVLAERLSIVDPADYHSLEELREVLIDRINERLYEIDFIPWAARDQQFHFIRSKFVIFSTPYRIEDPKEFLKVFELLPASSFFYHVIDARTRTETKEDDFCIWLKTFGNEYEGLVEKLQKVDPYFIDSKALKQSYIKIFTNFFIKETHG